MQWLPEAVGPFKSSLKNIEDDRHSSEGRDFIEGGMKNATPMNVSLGDNYSDADPQRLNLRVPPSFLPDDRFQLSSQRMLGVQSVHMINALTVVGANGILLAKPKCDAHLCILM